MTSVPNHVLEEMLRAVAQGRYVDVATALTTSCGVDVDQKDDRGRTVLADAAYRGDDDIVQALITNCGGSPCILDNEGTCPLSLAAAQNHVGCVEALLGSADVAIETVDCDGATPLIRAAAMGSTDSVEALLAREVPANVDATDVAMKTALMWAAERGHTETVECLLRHNADATLEDDQGRCAVAWAKTRDVVDVTRSDESDPREVCAQLIAGRLNSWPADVQMNLLKHREVARFFTRIGASTMDKVSVHLSATAASDLLALVSGEIWATKRAAKAAVKTATRLATAVAAFRRMDSNKVDGFLDLKELKVMVGERATTGMSFTTYYLASLKYPSLLSETADHVKDALERFLKGTASAQIQEATKLEERRDLRGALEQLQRAAAFLDGDVVSNVAMLPPIKVKSSKCEISATNLMSKAQHEKPLSKDEAKAAVQLGDILLDKVGAPEHALDMYLSANAVFSPPKLKERIKRIQMALRNCPGVRAWVKRLVEELSSGGDATAPDVKAAIKKGVANTWKVAALVVAIRDYQVSR